MLALSLTYRFISNFALLAMAYFSLNLIENYDQRAVLALLIMAYAGIESFRRSARFSSTARSSSSNPISSACWVQSTRSKADLSRPS